MEESRAVKESKPGFIQQIKSLPAPFWVANTMEIFERLSWYGWFAVMALYVTAPPENGGLGFSTEVRGNLQGIVPFFLYLFPVFTGALADRFGFKRMFMIAFCVMMVAYYSLGQFTSLPGFFLAFMFVAVGAAIFKPVVVGTVARVTDDSNSALGFGIFYMMVNVGGFVGPVVAGYVRGWSWDYVFMACSFWAFVNLLIVLMFYKEPEAPESRGPRKSVIDTAVEVLGNFRFFLTVGLVLVALMVAGLGNPAFTWGHCAVFVILWLGLNFLYDGTLPRDGGTDPAVPWFRQRLHCSNWRFALFLLIMSGFWTSFNQIFITMPEYIRDFSDTRPLIRTFESVFGKSDPRDPNQGIASKVATVSKEERETIRTVLARLEESRAQGRLNQTELDEASLELLESKVRVTPEQLKQGIVDSQGDVDSFTDRTIIEARQFNPEFIININAGSIVLFQIVVSFFMARFHRFTTMIAGMLVAAVGIGLSGFAGGEGMLGAGGSIWFVCLGLFIFSFGEMMASPTSQEYVGRIAPADKKALYMGYYFVAIALGNLFGGILSGQLYGWLARDLQRPDLMWACFGAIMFMTAVLFVLYNRFVVPSDAADSLTDEGSLPGTTEEAEPR
ncbi:MAG: MFS transporter [Armatimonadetes bacterium]|nr:MFS transporter [Armatimonadota bacterium]